MKARTNKKNFEYLYLFILNSSAISSPAATYKNVPTDTDKNIPLIKVPSLSRIQPIITPIGFRNACRNIMKVANFKSVRALAKAIPFTYTQLYLVPM
jgi:hypothetical protein